MTTIISKTAIGLAAALAFGASSASAVSLINGSFEDGTGVGTFGTAFDDLGTTRSWDIYSDGEVTGWTNDTNGIEIQTDDTLGFIDAYDGENYVELDTTQNSYMEQSVFLDVGQYVLTFAFAPRVSDVCGSLPCISTNAINYGISGAMGELFSLLADGPSTDVPFGTWTLFTYTFTVETADEYSLFFDATGTSNSLGGLIDGVSLAAVPVPAGGLLLLGALGGLAALRRRKSA
jgi:hypothetical protein